MNALFSQFNYITLKKDLQGYCLTLLDINFQSAIFSSRYRSHLRRRLSGSFS